MRMPDHKEIFRLLTIIVFVSFSCSTGVVVPPGKPNIILIITDQQRGDALGFDGGLPAITPNLDKLAASGYYFTNAYSAVPSCTPARAGLLTGLSPWHHGMLGYGRVARHYPFEMPRMLKDLGYYTFGIGKMHWYPQKSLHGFNGTIIDESGRVEQDGFISDYRDWFKLNAPGLDPDITGIGWNDHIGGIYQLDEKLHPTWWTAQTAIDFISEYNLDQPLFLMVSFARPHSPYDPPQRFFSLYEDADIPAPVEGNWDEEYKEWPGGKDAFYGDFGIESALLSRKYYLGSVSFIDEQVGRIMSALKSKGIYSNSLICFVSDHGDMLGDHYHWRKTYAFEGSSRIPFIVKLPDGENPGIIPGGAMENPVELRDLLPTFIEIAGGKVPEAMDGMSLLGLFSGKKVWRDYIALEHSSVYDYNNYWCAVTDGNYKYIWFFTTGNEMLFDLNSDPGERFNIACDSTRTDLLVLWRSRMADYLSERGDEWEKDGKPVIRKNGMLYSPDYPSDTLSEPYRLNKWRNTYKGFN